MTSSDSPDKGGDDNEACRVTHLPLVIASIWHSVGNVSLYMHCSTRRSNNIRKTSGTPAGAFPMVFKLLPTICDAGMAIVRSAPTRTPTRASSMSAEA